VADRLTGIAIPIEFRTNKIKHATARDEDAGPRFARAERSRPITGSMELFFSPHAVTVDNVDLLEPGKEWTKERVLYQKHNLHGEHQFLVPATVNAIEPDRYIWATKDRFSFGLVNGSPTTATGTETLQLVPCDQLNLDLFLDKLQSQPFYIEVIDADFALHVKDMQGLYRKLACQNYTPRCWHGSRHAVITTQATHSYKPILHLDSLPWNEIAELGTPT
jgi:hypothetical protein